jgi:hypothetical protein
MGKNLYASNLKLILCFFLLMAQIILPSGAMALSQLSSLDEIPIQSGDNDVTFVGFRRPVKIISSWYDNGNAHGKEIFEVIIKGDSYLKDTWLIVQFIDGTNIENTVSDDPLAGEDYGKSVRFFDATLDGTRKTVLFIAERDQNECCSYYSPSRTHISIYVFGPSPVTDSEYMY